MYVHNSLMHGINCNFYYLNMAMMPAAKHTKRTHSDSSDESRTKGTITKKVRTIKIFRVDSVDDDEDSVEELLSLAKSLQRKMSKKPANDEAMNEHGEKYKDMSEEDFLLATEESIASARDAHLNHLSRVKSSKRGGHNIQKQGDNTITKNSERKPRFHHRKNYRDFPDT
jgi:predicted DNA binding protein